MFKLDLEKAEEPEIKLPHPLDHSKSKRVRPKIYFCFIDYAKAFDCVDHNKLWKILQEMGIPGGNILYLPPEKSMQVKKQQLELDTEQQTHFKLGKEYTQGIFCYRLFNLYAEYIMRNAGMEEAQAVIKIAGRNINNLRYADQFSSVTNPV